MRAWILHLSDLHIHGARDPIVGLGATIAAAVRATDFDGRTIPATVIIAVTGDITFGATPVEFEAAARLLLDLKSALEETSGVTCHFAITPGNHDVSLFPEDPVRNLALDQLYRMPVTTDVFTALSKPQDNFWRFMSQLDPDIASSDARIPILWDKVVTCGSRTIVLRSVNTSWSSKLNEKEATVLLPTELLSAHPPPPDDAVSVCLLHHPYRWLTETSAHDGMTLIESWADLVLTGHEHRSSSYQKSQLRSPLRLYLEAPALQQHGANPLAGTGFAVLELNLARDQVSSTRYHRDSSGYYLPDTDKTVLNQQLESIRVQSRSAFQITTAFRKSLNDVGDIFTHPRAPLTLDAIFVEPRLELRPSTVSRPEGGGTALAPSVEIDLLTAINQFKQSLLIGSELGGKSALLRWSYQRMFEKGLLPILIDARRVKRGFDFDSLVSSAVKEQYGDTNTGSIKAAFAERGVALVDNIDALSRLKDQNRLVSLCGLKFYRSVFSSSGTPLVARTGSGDIEASQLWASSILDICELSHRERGAMILKWVELGRSESIDDEDPDIKLDRDVAHRDSLLSRVIRTQLMPSTPYYVLLVMNHLDSMTGEDERHASYGFLYQAMLTAALNSSEKRRFSVDTKIDYLTALAGRIWSSASSERCLSVDSFEAWHDWWLDETGLQAHSASMLEELVSSRVVTAGPDSVQFRYRTAFCFCVARWMAQAHSEADLKRSVETLVETLYREESHLIVMFLAHLVSSSVVGEELLRAMREKLTTTEPKCVLESVRPLLATLLDPPRVSLPSGSYLEVRAKLLEDMDAASRASTRIDDEIRGVNESDGEDDGVAIVRELMSSIRLITTAGQLLRKHGSSMLMRRELKVEIAREAYSLSLRSGEAVIGMIRDNVDGFLRTMLLHTLLRDDTVGSTADLERASRGMLQKAIFSLSVAVIRNPSDAMAGPLLMTIVEQAVSDFPLYTSSLFLSATRLEAHAGMPKDAIKVAVKQAGTNTYGLHVIAAVVAHAMHRYRFSVADVDFVCRLLPVGRRPALMDPSRKRLVD